MNLLVVILIQASFYALLGMGYVLIYRATRVLNLAHGDLMVFGAYLFFQTLVASGGNLTLAILLAVAGAALLGALVYLGVMRPLASYPVAVGVLAHHRTRIGSADHRHTDLVSADALSGTVARPVRAAGRRCCRA